MAIFVDDSLIAGWVMARSISRSLPEPVRDHGGWRVEVGSPTEVRRYVFANPVDGLHLLGKEISEPLNFLKLCAPPEVLRAMLPERWLLEPVGYVMQITQEMPCVPGPPDGYRLSRTMAREVTTVQFLTEDDEVAASGFAVECDGIFIYDRIVVAEAHQRRGLGRSTMLALAASKRDAGVRSVLIATPAGRALYETLGWTLVSDYSTAVIR